MLALRLGSYSMASTFAGTPSLSRRKSTLRYCFLWPPPRCQTTTSPWLLRPPERFFGSRSRFSGVSLVISFLSSTVMNRRDAVYGLKLFSPIAASCYSISAACTAATCFRSLLLDPDLPLFGYKFFATSSRQIRSFFRPRPALHTLSSSRDDSLRS